jgi:hypothetical protein
LAELQRMVKTLDFKLELIFPVSNKEINHLEQEILTEILTPVTLPEELSLKCYSINNIKLLNYFKIGHFKYK